ncbi:DUF397 domain-containing protein [Actinomadura sp. HBU206391]|uniref:DUF397 domain-containing protein n=1 Tax=Actinomadura sp. HBU206391 TaxID=2731692 RepID=UPI0016502C52|nr:DUF397 domain-containing protein [Actinomadura sp. HBU206391]MBC6461838.1 DUF397 domain-containing protein [Actinomadura sp. HBU206391]
MTGLFPSHTQWRKSSRSGGQGTDCVEVAAVRPRWLIAVRDSKDPGGPVLAFQPPEWDGFLSSIKTGELDLPTS